MSIGIPRIRDVNTETLTGTKTLVINDAYFQQLDPGGAGRTVTLPAAAQGAEVVIINEADAAEVLTIQDPTGPTTIATPAQNENAVCWSADGTTWEGLVGASS